MSFDLNKTFKKDEEKENVKAKIEAAKNCGLCNHTGWIVKKDFSDDKSFGVGTTGTASLCECQRKIKLVLGEQL